MKIVAYTALMYGKTYLEAAITSVIDSVDEHWFLYATRPSHGASSDKVNPDTRDELRQIAYAAAGNKCRWVDGTWSQEGEQRGAIHHYAPDADAIVVVDSDELFPTGLVDDLLSQTSGMHRKRIRVPFVHFYRDFNHCIVHDPAFPERLIYPQIVAETKETANTRPIAHMGYCQPAETIRFKLSIHGHKNELRCSADEYVDNIYLDNDRWTDLHPVGSVYWNAETVNPLTYMPSWMKYHPLYSVGAIK